MNASSHDNSFNSPVSSDLRPTVSSRTNCRNFNNLAITSSTFSPNSSTLALFNLSSKFVPRPNQCVHSDIRRGINDVLRKLQWRTIIRSSARPCRFVPKSTGEPPENLISSGVKRTCERMRASTNTILRGCTDCFGPDNLSSEQRAELDRLQADSSITIKPADKGGRWVIMPTVKYEEEVFRQLNNRDIYAATSKDFSTTTATRLKQLLLHIKSKGLLTARELKALLPPDEPKRRTFYILPKLHKEVWPDPEMPPGRPIISDVGSVSRQCASFIDYFLSPIAQSLPSYIRDSSHAIACLNDIQVTPSTILFTLDVTALYTNVPIEGGIEAVARAFLQFKDDRRPDLSILTMLRVLLTSNDFFYKDNHYLQVEGTAMGSAYGASFANIYMGEWEKNISRARLRPNIWLRYIDDIFGIWNYSLPELQDFVTFLNSICPNIKVKLEHHLTSILFLDLELYKSNTNIYHRIGFKPTHSHLILPPTSHHRSHVFKGIIYSQILRWATKSSTYEDFQHTKELVTPFWRSIGYTRSLIRSSTSSVLRNLNRWRDNWEPGFEPCGCSICAYATKSAYIADTMSYNRYQVIHRTTCLTSNVIYLITCKSCLKGYVGQTSRPLRRRIAEHLSNITNKRDTSVGKHFNICPVKNFTFTCIEIVLNETKRLQRENKWMRRLSTLAPNGMNDVINPPNGDDFVVLPNSVCADKIASHINRQLGVKPAFKTSANLRTLFN